MKWKEKVQRAKTRKNQQLVILNLASKQQSYDCRREMTETGQEGEYEAGIWRKPMQ